jgi:hypothetical protein
MRVDFKDPKGNEHHVLLVDPDEMTVGMRTRIQELLQLYMEPDVHSYLPGMKMEKKLIAEVVREWSLDLPLPKGDPVLLDDLPGWAYDELRKAAEPHRERLDFIQDMKNSSESKTPSTGTTSRAKSRTAKQ